MTRTLEQVEAEIAQTREALANVKGRDTEVYARIVGYYRSVRNWNKGKRDEYDQRKQFVYDGTNTSAHITATKEENPKLVWGEGKWLAHQQCVTERLKDCPKDCKQCPITGSTFNPIAEWVYGIRSSNGSNNVAHDNWLGVTSRKKHDYNSFIQFFILGRHYSDKISPSYSIVILR